MPLFTKPSEPVSLNFRRRIKFVLLLVVQRKSFSFIVSFSDPPVIVPSATRQSFGLPSQPFSVSPSKSEIALTTGGGAAACANDSAQRQNTIAANFMMPGCNTSGRAEKQNVFDQLAISQARSRNDGGKKHHEESEEDQRVH